MEKMKLHGGDKKATPSAGVLPARGLSAATAACGEEPGSGVGRWGRGKEGEQRGGGRARSGTLTGGSSAKGQEAAPLPRCEALTRW